MERAAECAATSSASCTLVALTSHSCEMSVRYSRKASPRGAAQRTRRRTMACMIKNCIVFLLVCTINLALTCPESCRCKGDTIDCVGCSYEMIPDKNASAVIVNVCCDTARKLATNTLKFNGNITFNNVTLTRDRRCEARYFDLVAPNLTTKSLILKSNSIEYIHFDINGTALTHLDLSNNSILEIENKTFNSFPNLSKLKIDMNRLKNLSQDCFAGLVNLKYLDLSSNNIKTLSNVFHPLKNLQHLNLSRNFLEYLSEKSFNNGLLQHLDVSHNLLSRVAPGALQCLPNLARLLLTDNPALGATQLDGQLLLGTGRRLQQVDVSRTGLNKIPEAFTHSVRFLSLAGNKISSINCGDLDSYPLLQSLDFTDNRVRTVEDDSFGRLEMILFLNLNKNLLPTVPKMLPDELKYLSINNNLIGNLTIPDFNNLPNLRILLLQNNVIKFIQENVFAPLMSLEVLDLSNNPVQILTPSTFNGPLSLRDLRLCYLNISLPERDVTFPVPAPEGLQMLHLQSSPGLARQLLADSAALAALSHLQYLDLRMNHLSGVRSDLMFYLSQLRTLRLHGNNMNCTNIDWLQEWVSKNHSSLKNETCYFSLQNGNEDENRYNCTFSETFTISDSLPPVSLYSTEMINKLLKYYGFLNKTETFNKKDSKFGMDNILTIKKKSILHYGNISNIPTVTSNSLNNLSDVKASQTLTNEIEHARDAILETRPRYTNEFFLAKKHTPESHVQTGIFKESSVSEKIYSRMIPMTHVLDDDNKLIETTSIDMIHERNKTGRTVNKAIKKRNNRTDKYINIFQSTESPLADVKYDTIKQTVKISALTLLNIINTTDKYDIVTMEDRSESSPFQSNYHGYASYVGVFAVTSLIAVCLVLWASLRLRYRQRRRIPSQQNNEDHIEVASISGGVLW